MRETDVLSEVHVQCALLAPANGKPFQIMELRGHVGATWQVHYHVCTRIHQDPPGCARAARTAGSCDGTPVSEPWLKGHVSNSSCKHDPGCMGAESRPAQSSACAGWYGVQGLLDHAAGGSVASCRQACNLYAMEALPTACRAKQIRYDTMHAEQIRYDTK